MPITKTPATTWFMLSLVSAITRLSGAFFLPNAFGDAYVYIGDIGALSTKLAAGTFRLTDLFGFWLPLYQFLSALLNLFVGNGFYSGKIVSSLFGVGACLFIYAITLFLTDSRRASLIIFLLIALNPLHVFYSASAMTDVPHAFFVLATLYFVLKQKWRVAAIFAALAGLTRVESWMFIAIIPFLQIIRERRVSILAVLIMLAPPVFWFYISWKAAGNPWACFQQRQQYLDWLLAMNPDIAHFSLRNIARDFATLLLTSELVVLMACFVAAAILVRQVLRRKPSEDIQSKIPRDRLEPGYRPPHFVFVLPPLVFFFAFLALLLVAYITHQQPIIFPRYGLILFTLGLPVLAWAFLRARERNQLMFRRLLIGAIIIFSVEFSIQVTVAVAVLNQYRAQRRVAEYLQTHVDPNSDTKIFCDEGTVRVLSGVPFDRFVTSSDAPRDEAGFLAYLRNQKVKYLVVARQPGSTPRKLFPELDSGGGTAEFRPILVSRTKFLPEEIWIYGASEARP